jgi:hypothetical protein
MSNVIEIIEAWVESRNPSSFRKELAIARLNICNNCDERKTIFKNIKPVQICGICKCPLDKKAFTTKKGDCPLKKWDTVENSELFIQKNNNTII